ncbi:14719_t:CDS:1, partial [Racocetra persica]
EKQKVEKEQKLDQEKGIIRQAFAEVAQIRAKETNPATFTKQDYQKIKNWQKKLGKLSKEKIADDFVVADIQDLQNSLQELEKLCNQAVKS